MNFNLGDIVEYKNYQGMIDFIDSCYIVVRGCKVGPEGNPPRLVIYPNFQDDVKIIEKSTLDEESAKKLLANQNYSCKVK